MENKLEVGREYEVVGPFETFRATYAGVNEGDLINFVYLEGSKDNKSPVRIISDEKNLVSVADGKVVLKSCTLHPIITRDDPETVRYIASKLLSGVAA